jgi:hypothetical protein
MAEIHPNALSTCGVWGAQWTRVLAVELRRWADLVVDDEGDDLEEIERAAQKRIDLASAPLSKQVAVV